MIDRELQKELLEKLKSSYPDKCSITCGELEHFTNYRGIKFNLQYLEEHGLIEGSKARPSPSAVMYGGEGKEAEYPVTGKITQRGIDFLEDDGGLSAILGTVTVRLHADTIRDLIECKVIESNDIPEKDKPRMITALKGMREEGLKQLTQRVVSHGLDQAPDAWKAIVETLSP